MNYFKIGDVARITGINISTLRLWEQHELITPNRTNKGQRIYSEDQVQKIHNIIRMRKVEGLNMSAIKRTISSNNNLDEKSTELNRNSIESVSLGIRFRSARLKQKLSINSAAKITGLPVSFISTFERTSRGATVTTLQKMAACYKTTVTELSSTLRRYHKGSAEVVRLGGEEMPPQFDSSIKILQLSNILKTLDCQRWILAPNARSEGAYSHEGEEFIYVLRGEFTISVDGEPSHFLYPGDSISFESQKSHMWMAGNIETELVWINTPKSY